MKEVRMQLVVAAIATVFCLSGAQHVRAADVPEPKPPGGSIMQMDKFYPGTSVKVGKFPGKLVCLRTDDAFVPASAEECGDENRVYALSMEQEGVVHPLLAGTESVLAKFRALIGANVVVEGKYYSSTGLIMASAINAAQ